MNITDELFYRTIGAIATIGGALFWYVLTKTAENKSALESMRKHHDAECEKVKNDFNNHIIENERSYASLKDQLIDKHNKLELAITRLESSFGNLSVQLENVGKQVEILITEIRKK